jgi:hypothetical protein
VTYAGSEVTWYFTSIMKRKKSQRTPRTLQEYDERIILRYSDRLCGLVVSVEDYKHRGPGFDSRALLRIFLRELGLERGPLSLVIG